MRRETRFNLIFLGLFLAISLPGAVILFKKKLQPGASRMSMPDAVRREIVYTAPIIVPDSVKRVAPPEIAGWAEQQGALLAGGPIVRAQAVGTLGLPPISENRSLEVVGVSDSKTEQQGETLILLAWQKEPLVEANYGPAEVIRDDEKGLRIALEVAERRVVPLPAELRRALVTLGHIDPPTEVLLLRCRHAGRLPREIPLKVFFVGVGNASLFTDFRLPSDTPN